MRRLFWAGLGAAIGVFAVRKVTKTAQSYTPRGLAHGLSDMGAGLREIADSVREAMAERDAELRQALGVDEGHLSPAQTRALIDDPTADLSDVLRDDHGDDDLTHPAERADRPTRPDLRAADQQAESSPRAGRHQAKR
ncbi:MAG: DUF6167 family protein [Actinomycetota bacterium]